MASVENKKIRRKKVKKGKVGGSASPGPGVAEDIQAAHTVTPAQLISEAKCRESVQSAVSTKAIFTTIEKNYISKGSNIPNVSEKS